mmetsp:Transcript_4945/g.13385  ORF Transcript_4945/g.13385 Transcript_4945/m.13385 type:complete len:335 (-) Transcript_4945:1222-2226(-)
MRAGGERSGIRCVAAAALSLPLPLPVSLILPFPLVLLVVTAVPRSAVSLTQARTHPLTHCLTLIVLSAVFLGALPPVLTTVFVSILALVVTVASAVIVFPLQLPLTPAAVALPHPVTTSLFVGLTGMSVSPVSLFRPIFFLSVVCAPVLSITVVVIMMGPCAVVTTVLPVPVALVQPTPLVHMAVAATLLVLFARVVVVLRPLLPASAATAACVPVLLSVSLSVGPLPSIVATAPLALPLVSVAPSPLSAVGVCVSITLTSVIPIALSVVAVRAMSTVSVLLSVLLPLPVLLSVLFSVLLPLPLPLGRPLLPIHSGIVTTAGLFADSRLPLFTT